MANVTGTDEPKARPWERHLLYLRHLDEVFDSVDEPFIAAGDYNQRYPRQKGGNKKVAEALATTFRDLDIVTAGTIRGCEKPGIDHIAVTPQLAARNVSGWPHNVTGNRLTDHDGAMCEIYRREVTT